MAKVLKLSFAGSDQMHTTQLVESAFLAAVSPFASIGDGEILWPLVEEFVYTKPRQSVELATRVLRHLHAVDGVDQLASVEFGMWELTLITPSSSTRIRVRHFEGGDEVTVTFPQPSSTRADMILAASAGIEWEIERVPTHKMGIV